jgi:hypothetical protein
LVTALEKNPLNPEGVFITYSLEEEGIPTMFYLTWKTHQTTLFLVIEESGVLTWTRGRFGKETQNPKHRPNHRQRPTKLTYTKTLELRKLFHNHPAIATVGV